MKTKLYAPLFAGGPALGIALGVAIAYGGDRVPLVVNGGRVQQAGSGDVLVVPQVRTSLVQAGVLATDPLRYNDWHPTGLGTNTTFQIQAGDNTGNWITGIDAIGASIALNTRITICNANAPQDDGAVALIPENSSSLANNRIWVPGYGRNSSQITYNTFTIGPTSCADLLYIQPDQSDPTTKRWMVIGGDSRHTISTIKQLELFPYSFPAPITSGTTVNDYDALDSCLLFGSGYPVDGRCEAGADIHQQSYTSYFVSTSSTGTVTITGLKYASSGSQAAEAQGAVKFLCNYGPGLVKLTNNDTGSTALDQFNISAAGNAADVVLSSGKCILMHHLRDIGKWVPMTKSDYLFDARDVTMTAGLLVTGVDAAVSFVANVTLAIDQPLTGRTTGAENIYVRDVGSYNTTGGALTAAGMIIAQDATRSGGGNNFTNVALQLDASGGQVNYALQTTNGQEYHGLGSQQTFDYHNTALFDVSGATKLGGNFQVGGDDFNGGAVKFQVQYANGHIVTGGAGVTFTNGSCSSTNCTDMAGTVTSSSTSMTITFAATYTGASDATCIILPQGTATMPVCTETATAITCSTVVSATKYNYQCIGHQ